MMTASFPPSSAADRLSRRATGALLALAVQALFVTALLLWIVQPPSRGREQKEVFFRMVPTAPPVPPAQIIGAAPAHRSAAPAPAPLTAAPVVAAPSSGIAGFGQSLFGCAPEQYASLAPDARAHCIKPGTGMAYNSAPDLMGAPSHVKDNARWANARVHKQPLPMLPGGLLFPLVALGAVLDGSITEPHSAFRDRDQWPAEDDPNKYMPNSLHEQENFYDDWNRRHATASPSAASPAAAASP